VKRRITEAIVGVAAVVLLALGFPLAVATHRSILDSAVVDLHARAAQTLTEIAVPLDTAQLAKVRNEPDAPPPFGVYDTTGRIMFGVGPADGGAAVQRALKGSTASTTDGEIVVATPISDHSTEKVVGVLRLTKSLKVVNHRSTVAWLVMAAAGLAALGVGWIIARRLARQLSRPFTDLAEAASRIGDGGRLEPPPVTGLGEIDTLAAALTESSVRVTESLARERRFSADVSHQLRTPLTALRLKLETARAGEVPHAAIDSALTDLQRIDETVEHLLAFARDSIPSTATVRLDRAATMAAERWATRVKSEGRSIAVDASASITTRGSAASVDQVIDVLIDNALHHGVGAITVTPRRVAGGGAVDVADCGQAMCDADAARVFERGEGHHNGIGLALARSLAEADGGRLLLAHLKPTTFSLILLAPDSA
jgi:signal transduction histidine kinase